MIQGFSLKSTSAIWRNSCDRMLDIQAHLFGCYGVASQKLSGGKPSRVQQGLPVKRSGSQQRCQQELSQRLPDEILLL
jgi:hypothetical protein